MYQVACIGGKAVPLSTDHKPNLPSERARVQVWTPAGRLAVDGLVFRVYAGLRQRVRPARRRE